MRRPLLIALISVGVLAVVLIAVLVPLGVNDWGRSSKSDKTSNAPTSGGSPPPPAPSPSGTTGSGSPPTGPRTLLLVIDAPAQVVLPDRAVLTSSAPGASTAELATVTWRLVSGPAAFWSSGGATATGEFARSGSYVLEASITSATNTVTTNRTTVTVLRPTSLRATFEGELPIRYNQFAEVGPRIATDDLGNIYLGYVDRNLNTTIAQHKLGADAATWTVTPIGPADDEENHCKPAIATDKRGRVHVVYNMHGSPWTYSVTKRSADITEWEYRGGDLSNQRSVTPGMPGVQITYPHISRSTSGELWLSFRECTNCSNPDFFSRLWSGGVLRYNEQTETWARIGPFPFAQGEAYRPQYITPWHHWDNSTSLAWVWGKQYTAAEQSTPYFNDPNYPSYVRTFDNGQTFYFANGSLAPLPLRFSTSDLILDPRLIRPALDRSPSTDEYFGSINDVTLNVTTGQPIVTTRYHWTTFNPTSGWLQMFNDTNKVPFSGAYLRYNLAGQLFAISGSGQPRGIFVHSVSPTGARLKSEGVDLVGASLGGRPQYYVDEQHYLATGGEVLRLALMYINVTEPVARVFTVALGTS